VRENVFISYRGANYELGQWPMGYGIWGATTSQLEPLEGWPATPEGWSAAWYRFNALEAPGTIQPVSPPVSEPVTPPVSQTVTLPTAVTAAPVSPFFAPPGNQATYGSPAGTAPDEVSFGQAQADTGPYTQPAYAPPGYGQPGYAPSAYGQPAYGHMASRPARTPFVISTARAWTAAALLGVGVVIGIIGLFPTYTSGSSLASETFNLVPHLIYLAAWALCAVLIARGGGVRRVGTLLGVGTSAVTFGLFFADAGTPMAGGSHLAGAGLWLSILGWAACAGGSVLALGTWPTDWPRRVRGREIPVVATLIVAALGTAIAFAPSWDRFTLSTATSGSQTFTAGNAFSNPGPVIVGEVAVMLALFAVVIVAALWRPGRLGWALAAGAAVPMVAQAISAVVQITTPATPAQFGISSSAAAQAGLKISSGLTGAFWAFLAFMLVLIIGCIWLAITGDREEAVPARLTQTAGAGATPAATAYAASTAYAVPSADPVQDAAAEAPPHWATPHEGDDQVDSPPSEPTAG
jgi:hypothetical protein